MNRAMLCARLADARPFHVPAGLGVQFVHDVLLASNRWYPVVGVTVSRLYERSFVDAGELARELRGRALVVVLPDDEMTWTVAHWLGCDLGVHNGYVRVWRPGLGIGSSRRDHPLFRIERAEDAHDATRRIVLAVRYGPAPAVSPLPSPRPVPRPVQPMSVIAPRRVGVPYDPSGSLGADLGWWSSNV